MLQTSSIGRPNLMFVHHLRQLCTYITTMVKKLFCHLLCCQKYLLYLFLGNTFTFQSFILQAASMVCLSCLAAIKHIISVYITIFFNYRAESSVYSKKTSTVKELYCINNSSNDVKTKAAISFIYFFKLKQFTCKNVCPSDTVTCATPLPVYTVTHQQPSVCLVYTDLVKSQDCLLYRLHCFHGNRFTVLHLGPQKKSPSEVNDKWWLGSDKMVKYLV